MTRLVSRVLRTLISLKSFCIFIYNEPNVLLKLIKVSLDSTIAMKNILNITNGDIAIEIMQKAGIPGTFLSWNDVLYDGPVPKGLTLEELSEVRAEFIIGRNWGEPQNIRRSFIERDNVLKSCDDFDKVILWFEHDLYDQLQILQILDWFHKNSKNEVELSIICRGTYLGMLSPSEMSGFVKYEEPITEKHLSHAANAWAAFRDDSPIKWSELLDEDTSVLPFLEGAILRLLEEYPDCISGLSRTEKQALQIISGGETLVGKVFGLNQDLEERIFLGDLSFWVILQELIDSTPALLELADAGKLISETAQSQKITITSIGLDVLSGRKNWIDLKNHDRWFGGVHQQGKNIWCWDAGSSLIAKST